MRTFIFVITILITPQVFADWQYFGTDENGTKHYYKPESSGELMLMDGLISILDTNQRYWVRYVPAVYLPYENKILAESHMLFEIDCDTREWRRIRAKGFSPKGKRIYWKEEEARTAWHKLDKPKPYILPIVCD